MVLTAAYETNKLKSKLSIYTCIHHLHDVQLESHEELLELDITIYPMDDRLLKTYSF